MKNIACIASGKLEFVSSFNMSGNTFVWASSPNRDEAIDFGENEAKALTMLLHNYGNSVQILPAYVQGDGVDIRDKDHEREMRMFNGE